MTGSAVISHSGNGHEEVVAVRGLSVDYRARGGLLLTQWGLLGLLSMAVVWPFGTVLAAVGAAGARAKIRRFLHGLGRVEGEHYLFVA